MTISGGICDQCTEFAFDSRKMELFCAFEYLTIKYAQLFFKFFNLLRSEHDFYVHVIEYRIVQKLLAGK